MFLAATFSSRPRHLLGYQKGSPLKHMLLSSFRISVLWAGVLGDESDVWIQTGVRGKNNQPRQHKYYRLVFPCSVVESPTRHSITSERLFGKMLIRGALMWPTTFVVGPRSSPLGGGPREKQWGQRRQELRRGETFVHVKVYGGRRPHRVRIVVHCLSRLHPQRNSRGPMICSRQLGGVDLIISCLINVPSDYGSRLLQGLVPCR